MASVTYTKNNWLKLTYQEYVGHVISPATWYRIKNAMRENDLPVSVDSVKFVASLKAKFKDSKLNISNLLHGYLQSVNLDRHASYKGEDVFAELKKIAGFRCQDVTIIRWFRDIPKDKNGCRFSRTRSYTASELHPVYLRAYYYQKHYASQPHRISVKPENTVAQKNRSEMF